MKNDAILLDYIVGNNDGKNFESFCLQQYFKNYDLSSEEIVNGIIDGCDDAGIDAIFLFCNDILINDNISKEMLSNVIKYEIYIVTSKHDDSFKEAPIDSLFGTLIEFFDLTKENDDLISNYNADLLYKRNMFIKILKENYLDLEKFNINIIYLSRGNTKLIDERVNNRAICLKNSINNLMPNSNVNFNFVGSTEILLLTRKKRNRKSKLVFKASLLDSNNYIFLVNLKDYYNFITEDGFLKRHFFDSNIRAYLGKNRVNKDIYQSLEKKNNIEFWNLNNGITILADRAGCIGNTVDIENVQIVNGMQTSETIYNYFNNNFDIVDDRKIMVKLIVNMDKCVKDEIIKSTNNQTEVQLSALKATDKIQRDIEERLLLDDLYYERRTNYYFNGEVDSSKIITPLMIAIANVSLVHKYPYQAIKVKSRFMSNENNYKLIFDEKLNINIWSVIAKIYKKTEFILLNNDLDIKRSPRFMKYMVPLLSYLVVSKKFSNYNYKVDNLVKFDVNSISDELFLDVLKQILDITKDWDGYNSFKKKQKLEYIFIKFAELNHIAGVDYIIKRNNPFMKKMPEIEVDEDFIELVKNHLPEKQPWPIGTHTKIGKELGEFTPKVSKAIHILESRGIIYKQVGQVLYDVNGNKVKV